MNNVMTINNLISDKHFSCCEIANTLKIIGKGSMQNGIRRIATNHEIKGFVRGYIEGENNGMKKGILIGIAGLGILYFAGKFAYDVLMGDDNEFIEQLDKIRENEEKEINSELNKNHDEIFKDIIVGETKNINESEEINNED